MGAMKGGEGVGKGYEMGQGAGNGEKYPVTDVSWSQH